MAKTTQVTNDQERDEMQKRIDKAALHLSDPLMDEEEKLPLMPAYDKLVRLMKAYDHEQYCEKYPAARPMYEEAGLVKPVVKVEPKPVVPKTPVISSNYADFLDD